MTKRIRENPKIFSGSGFRPYYPFTYGNTGCGEEEARVPVGERGHKAVKSHKAITGPLE
jgi:hypothetical protein